LIFTIVVVFVEFKWTWLADESSGCDKSITDVTKLNVSDEFTISVDLPGIKKMILHSILQFDIPKTSESTPSNFRIEGDRTLFV
jgi:hypothetical protein